MIRIFSTSTKNIKNENHRSTTKEYIKKYMGATKKEYQAKIEQKIVLASGKQSGRNHHISYDGFEYYYSKKIIAFKIQKMKQIKTKYRRPKWFGWSHPSLNTKK